MSNFLFLSHTHGFLDDISMLQTVLKKYSPTLVFHEQLQHIQDVSSLSPSSKLYVENKDVIQLCSQISLKGFDMENFGFSSGLMQKMESNSLTSKDIETIDLLLLQREQLHVSLLQNLREKGLVLVIAGAWHLRTDGLIRKSFPNEKYILVLDDTGKECLEPSPNARFSE
jgi:hypothetical protein